MSHRLPQPENLPGRTRAAMNSHQLQALARSPKAINILVGLLLVSALVALVLKTRGIDLEAHNALLSDMRLLKQIDAEWNADVLKAKMGLIDNYDPVASPLPVIQRLETSLASREQSIDGRLEGKNGDIDAVFGAYKSAMDDKVRLIEQFKSQNAILRNSTHFLPTSLSEVSAMSREAGQNSEQAYGLVQTLYSEIMTFGVIPDESMVGTIDKHLSELHDVTASWPEAARESIGVFASHVKTVLRQQGVSVSILSRLNAIPTAARIDELTDHYSREHDRLLVSQQRYRTLLIAYSAFLLLLVAYIGFRLIRSYRKISELNAAALHKANVELNEVQLQLIQSEKMSALGQMVAGIAHEINTPLAFVKSTMDVVSDQMEQIRQLAHRCNDFLRILPDKSVEKNTLHHAFYELRDQARGLVKDMIPEEMTTLLNDGSRGIEQISEIVLNLKNFSRLDRAKVTEFDLQEGFESTLLLARNTLKDRIRIEKHFDNTPKIQCSPSQINQVFLNIISNAAQAIPDKGVITLRTAPENKDMVRIEISDDGAGIPPDVLPRIFDPFFTTKGVGKGTGMGLSISFKIISEHGGKIVVDSEVGIGTTFTILLPIRQEKQAALVEDEPVALAA